MSAGEVAQIGSAAFAAAAAIGSCGAALVMYRQWAAASTPALGIDIAHVHPHGTLFLTAINYGAPVKKVSFAAVEGDQACMSFLPPTGFLGPGEKARVQLAMNATDDPTIAVVYGFDIGSRWVYAWSANGQVKRWPARSSRWRRRPTELSAVQILQGFYPHAPDPTTLNLCPSALVDD